jgi:hypothetical protein
VRNEAAFNIVFPAARHGRKAKREGSPQPEKKKDRGIARRNEDRAGQTDNQQTKQALGAILWIKSFIHRRPFGKAALGLRQIHNHLFGRRYSFIIKCLHFDIIFGILNKWTSA